MIHEDIYFMQEISTQLSTLLPFDISVEQDRSIENFCNILHTFHVSQETTIFFKKKKKKEKGNEEISYIPKVNNAKR